MRDAGGQGWNDSAIENNERSILRGFAHLVLDEPLEWRGNRRSVVVAAPVIAEH